MEDQIDLPFCHIFYLFVELIVYALVGRDPETI